MIRLFLPCMAVGFALLACNFPGGQSVPPADPSIETQAPPAETVTAPSAETQLLLTICLASEPRSLFIFNDSSLVARSVRQAIYDGPLDVLDYSYHPVILERLPTLSSGDATVQPVAVQPGDLILDSRRNLVTLSEGASYYPAGCTRTDCAQSFASSSSTEMDQLVVRFTMRPNLLWSDGAALTAADSVFAYQVARAMYPAVRPDLLAYTQSYQAVDEVTVEWRGVPGYRASNYPSFFFAPLPRHAWGDLAIHDLSTSELVNRTPLAWGPYKIDEWTPGDHISLSRNPHYFRASENLPFFDRLVYRFVPDQEQALAALLAGECDYLDESYQLQPRSAELIQLQEEGRLKLAFIQGTAWEHLDFGITPANPDQVSLFQSKETRQAIAACIDRQRLVDELFAGRAQVPDSYLPPEHPLSGPEVKKYAFEPSAANALLDSIGWRDADSDPSTPRLSQGVSGVPDGTALQFALLTTDEAEKQRAAKILQESLAQCGVSLEINPLRWETLYQAGPDGPLFGRNFAVAQFSWAAAVEPMCNLYTTQEIPGPTPQYTKGWGGANASGYSNPAFDQACWQALSSLPEQPEHRAAHLQAQMIFAEDLPALPLYMRFKLVATRPDLCGLETNKMVDHTLSSIEMLSLDLACNP